MVKKELHDPFHSLFFTFLFSPCKLLQSVYRHVVISTRYTFLPATTFLLEIKIKRLRVFQEKKKSSNKIFKKVFCVENSERVKNLHLSAYFVCDITDISTFYLYTFIEAVPNPRSLHHLYTSLYLNIQSHRADYVDSMVRDTLPNHSSARILLCDAPIALGMETMCHKHCIWK